jgi:excisionase family DNA binding protein
MTLTVEREYLTVAEVAALWRVSVPTIYRHVAASRVPHIRVGGRDGPIRIPASAVMGVPVDGSPAGAASPAQTPLSAADRTTYAARPWDADMRSLRSQAAGSQPPGR